MVCHTQRYYPALVEARRRIEAGELHVQHVIYRYTFFRRDTVNWRGRRRSWADNLLWHHGAHAVDTALWLLGARESRSRASSPGQPRRSTSRWTSASSFGRLEISS